MDLSLRTEQYQVEDRSWLGSAHGTEATRTITLDAALFTEATHYPDGYIPSGMVLAKVTATGLYGPYNSALTNGQQTPVGHLFNSVVVRDPAAHLGAPLFTHGAVVVAKLPANSGYAAAVATALVRIEYR